MSTPSKSKLAILSDDPAQGSCSTGPSVPTAEPIPPGLDKPRVIDEIYSDTEAASVLLLLKQTAPWPHDDLFRFCQTLEEKLNNYLDYILDGFLAEQFPQYRGLTPTIGLRYHSPPPKPVVALLEAFARFCKPLGVHFESQQATDSLTPVN